MDSRSTSEFPGFGNVFLLGERGATRAMRVDLESGMEEALSLTRGDHHVSAPVVARGVAGRRQPSDVIFTTYAAPVLIHDRIVAALVEAQAKGWGTFAVRVLDRDGVEVPGYHGLTVVGRCGVIENERSVPTIRATKTGPQAGWTGIYFDPASWDGSDLFMPSVRYGWIFVTDRVRHCFDRGGDVVFTALDAVERSEVEMRIAREHEQAAKGG